jgi:hypothetical protein
MKLKPSRRLALLLVLAHALAVGVVWWVALPIGLHISLKLAIAVSLLLTVRQAGWFGNRARPIEFRIEPARKSGAPDAIAVRLRNNTTLRGLVLEGSFVAPYLAIVRFKSERQARFSPAKSILVMSDSLDSETFRTLRVRLKWGSPAAV